MPKQAIAIYPGLGDVSVAVLASCPRSLIFGGTATVERYKGNPAFRPTDPGFSKVLLGDDVGTARGGLEEICVCWSKYGGRGVALSIFWQ